MVSAEPLFHLDGDGNRQRGALSQYVCNRSSGGVPDEKKNHGAVTSQNSIGVDGSSSLRNTVLRRETEHSSYLCKEIEKKMILTHHFSISE